MPLQTGLQSLAAILQARLSVLSWLISPTQPTWYETRPVGMHKPLPGHDAAARKPQRHPEKKSVGTSNDGAPRGTTRGVARTADGIGGQSENGGLMRSTRTDAPVLPGSRKGFGALWRAHQWQRAIIYPCVWGACCVDPRL